MDLCHFNFGLNGFNILTHFWIYQIGSSFGLNEFLSTNFFGEGRKMFEKKREEEEENLFNLSVHLLFYSKCKNLNFFTLFEMSTIWFIKIEISVELFNGLRPVR